MQHGIFHPYRRDLKSRSNLCRRREDGAAPYRLVVSRFGQLHGRTGVTRYGSKIGSDEAKTFSGAGNFRRRGVWRLCAVPVPDAGTRRAALNVTISRALNPLTAQDREVLIPTRIARCAANSAWWFFRPGEARSGRVAGGRQRSCTASANY